MVLVLSETCIEFIEALLNHPDVTNEPEAQIIRGEIERSKKV